MPFINIKTNQSVSNIQKDALKTAMGQAISALSGKSEQWLMVGIEREYILYHQGSDAPAAMVTVQVYGSPSSSDCNALTGRISEALNAILEIPKNRIYVSYAGTPDWGWNGSNF